MAKRFPTALKESLIRRMTGPEKISACALARESGICQQTLSRWRQAATLGTMSNAKRRPQDWKQDEILAFVAEALRVPDTELGAFLRKRGVHRAARGVEDAHRGWPGGAGEAGTTVTGQESHQRARARAGTQGEGACRGRRSPGASKKSPRDLGGRGRKHDAETRRRIVELIDEAVIDGARLGRACAIVGLSVRTVQRWRLPEHADDRRRGPVRPANRLSEEEQESLLTLANTAEYADLSPHQIVVQLADQGSTSLRSRPCTDCCASRRW